MPLPTPENGTPQPTTVRPPQQRSVIQHNALVAPLLEPQETARTRVTTDEEPIPVVFELNLLHAGGVVAAYQAFLRMWREGVPAPVPSRFQEYVVAHLSMTQIRALAKEDEGRSKDVRTIHRVWPDFPMDILTAVQASNAV
jgi:hypothetical protein